MDGKYIADAIRRLRKSNGMTVDEVGRGVGRSGKTVSAWETGRNVPSADMLIDICRFFGVNIDYFYPPEVTKRPQLVAADVNELDELAALYRSMTDEGRAQLMIFARGLAATYPKNQVDSAIA